MKRLALTIGDPTGIGSEITIKALQRLDALPDVKLDIIGNLDVLLKTANDIGVSLPNNDQVTYHDITVEHPGHVAYQSIETAVNMVAAGDADAIVTGPISKKNLMDAGHAAHGHTEILESLAQRLFNAPDARAEMLFVHQKFRLLLLTRHIPLSEVPAALSKQGAVARPLKSLIAFLRYSLDIFEPRIAMLAVNPHAGEVGGDEDKKYIAPVIHAVNGIGASQLVGPMPADGFFRGFDPQNSGYDAVVAAYHDQGLIPFKLLSGYEAVNMTIGLPFIRTSVSHGTAEDIVGKNLAREDSLIAAIQTASETIKIKQ